MMLLPDVHSNAGQYSDSEENVRLISLVHLAAWLAIGFFSDLIFGVFFFVKKISSRKKCSRKSEEFFFVP